MTQNDLVHSDETAQASPGPAEGTNQPQTQTGLTPSFFQDWRRNAIHKQMTAMRQAAGSILNEYQQLNLSGLPDEKLFSEKLRYTANILAVYSTRSQSYTLLGLIFIRVWRYFILPSPFILNFWLHRSWTLGSYLLYLVEFYLLLILPALPALFMPRLPKRRRGTQFSTLTNLLATSSMFVIVINVIGLYIYLTRFVETFPRPDLVPWVAQMSLAVLFTYAAMLILFLGFGIWDWLMYFYFDRPFTKKHVDAMIIHQWINLILDLEKHPGWWNDLAYKRDLTRQLEQLARRIERDLPAQLSSGDAASDVWLQGAARQFSASLRDKKKIVLTPKPDSYRYLVGALKADFLCVLSGNWDGLSRKEPERLNASTLLNRLQRMLIVLVQGLLPLLVFFALRYYVPGISQQLSDTLLGGSVIWFFLSIFMELDPDFKEKLNLLKAVKDTLK